MKLVAQVKLLPTPEQAEALKETMVRANEACDYISRVAWDTRTFGKFGLQKLVYQHVKETFSLTAQVVVRCIAKVADAYKLDKKTERMFKPLGAISYDSRILRYKMAKGTVSIWTVQGRMDVAWTTGKRQWELLQTQQGESDLAFVRGKFYLLSTCEVETPTPDDVEGVLGVDLGINNIASTSDGEKMSGSHVKSVRHRNRRLRAKLQKKGTRSAKRKLRSRSGREARFSSNTNHVIAKRIVEMAKRTNRAIALEQLKGIRSRVRAKRPQRATLHSWAFAELGEYIKYKATRAGVPVVFVDPRNTSRECSCCGHIEKANRPSQAVFKCQVCGFAAHADLNASVNIGRRAEVMLPNVSEIESKSVHAALQKQAPRL